MTGPVGVDEKICLIGHSGFVGGVLQRQTCVSDRFNSTTIGDIAGRAFDRVICAAAPGSMFEANRQPDRDRSKVHALIDHLAQVEAREFVLISSIAVFADFAGGDDETSTAFQTELAYGRHRRELEAFVEDRFQRSLIVRLPALFGAGLRKNFLFDLLNPVPTMVTGERLEQLVEASGPQQAGLWRGLYAFDDASQMHRLDRAALNRSRHRSELNMIVRELGLSATQFHHRDTTYQYYEINRLWGDIERALHAGLDCIHLVNEPLQAAAIHQRLTGEPMPATGARLHREDMRTRHAELWGKSGPYIESAGATLERLAAFYDSERVAA